MTDTLPVAEVFGRTFQGEGPSAGRLAAFIRLGGCNLTCRDCDTPYTWDGQLYDLRAELTQMTAAQILAKLPDAPLVVITGGEPMMYQNREVFLRLVSVLVKDMGKLVEVETNGTRIPEAWTVGNGVKINVSPKLAGPMSDDPEDRRIVPEALAAYAYLARIGQARWKFVVRSVEDVQAAINLTDAYIVPAAAVWMMPAGTTPDDTLDHARAVADAALAAGVNLTLRQHILLWPDTARGR